MILSTHVVHLSQDLDLPGKLGDVYVRDVTCGDPIEKL